MSGKAKPQKHTAKEIAMKAHEAKMKKGGRGGGEDGLEKKKEKYFYQVHYLLYHATFR